MKINQLLSGVDIALTNAEQQFVESHGKSIRLSGLDDHSKWIAQSLVRKGVYDISRDSTTLINNLHETNT